MKKRSEHWTFEALSDSKSASAINFGQGPKRASVRIASPDRKNLLHLATVQVIQSNTVMLRPRDPTGLSLLRRRKWKRVRDGFAQAKNIHPAPDVVAMGNEATRQPGPEITQS